ncbi:hypothetical protein B0H17DRAFT_1154078 [Mycena rosella]|uniref:Uncharacterized protein n=1 Tax=Mycena rosella TaxID=1033263 RepID=A0AAD7F9Y5_MYCRO|nr:hypothetical protein B0H17DRAFT_1154078 [Mycena rosella]
MTGAGGGHRRLGKMSIKSVAGTPKTGSEFQGRRTWTSREPEISNENLEGGASATGGLGGYIKQENTDGMTQLMWCRSLQWWDLEKSNKKGWHGDSWERERCKGGASESAAEGLQSSLWRPLKCGAARRQRATDMARLDLLVCGAARSTADGRESAVRDLVMCGEYEGLVDERRNDVRKVVRGTAKSRIKLEGWREAPLTRVEAQRWIWRCTGSAARRRLRVGRGIAKHRTNVALRAMQCEKIHGNAWERGDGSAGVRSREVRRLKKIREAVRRPVDAPGTFAAMDLVMCRRLNMESKL